MRYFDPDEFQHLHGARQIYHGDVPYRDYFEHHTPLLHFVLAKFYPVFGEEMRILFAARTLMMVFTGAILCLTCALGAMLYGIDAGLFAALFLSYVIMFLEKTIEVRPDLPAVMFWLSALIFMVKGIQRNSNAPALRWHWFSGVCMGAAVMSTQKALFAFGGISLSLLWMLADRRIGGSFGYRLRQAAVFLGGVMTPIAVMCLYFLAHGSLWQFINCNFIMNFQWKVSFKPYNYIRQLLSQNPFFSVIGVLGLFTATVRTWKKGEATNGSFVPVLPAYTLIACLFVVPVPYRQYYMMFLPLLALYCGYLARIVADVDVRDLASRLRNLELEPLSVGFALLAVNTLFGGLLHVFRFSKPTILNSSKLYLLLWAVLIAAAGAACLLSLLTRHSPPIAHHSSIYIVLFLCLGIIAYPLQQTVDQRKNRNDGQLAAARFIMDATSPDDAVLDGWSGPGFLRDHAYFYFFLHSEMRAMLTEKQLSDDVIESVEKKKAKIIVYDDSIKALPKKVQDYISANYAPAGHGDIYVRVMGDGGQDGLYQN